MDTRGRRSLYNNLQNNTELVLKIDAAVLNSRQDSWRGITAKEQLIKRAIAEHLADDAEVERVFRVIKEHY